MLRKKTLLAPIQPNIYKQDQNIKYPIYNPMLLLFLCLRNSPSLSLSLKERKESKAKPLGARIRETKPLPIPCIPNSYSILGSPFSDREVVDQSEWDVVLISKDLTTPWTSLFIAPKPAATAKIIR